MFLHCLWIGLFVCFGKMFFFSLLFLFSFGFFYRYDMIWFDAIFGLFVLQSAPAWNCVSLSIIKQPLVYSFRFSSCCAARACSSVVFFSLLLQKPFRIRFATQAISSSFFLQRVPYWWILVTHACIPFERLCIWIAFDREKSQIHTMSVSSSICLFNKIKKKKDREKKHIFCFSQSHEPWKKHCFRSIGRLCFFSYTDKSASLVLIELN